jgi:hypothetical protein
MMEYAPLLLLVPLAILALYLINDYWTETEGLFTMIYLCAILSVLVGWTMTDILDYNIFLR